MPSPSLLRGRVSRIGACYSITTVVLARKPLLVLPGHVEILRREWDRMHDEGAVLSHAWVAMPDHLHWLFQLQHASLGQCMRRFKSRTAHAINEHMGRSGALWQPGYYEHRLRHDNDLLRHARYLVENPVRKGLAGSLDAYPHWWCRWISGSQDLC